MQQKIRWGILGLGSIAHSFIKDLLLVNDAELTAVASRNGNKALEFSSQYNSKYAFGSYKELFECEEVDIIYIATPHSFHAEIAIEAMSFKKHVLCEKPMGVNLLEVTKMIDTAHKNEVFLMEALWSRFNPTIQKVKQLIDDDVIGEIRYVHADFAFTALHRDEENRLLNPNLAGGSLLDIGIYPVFLSYLILGKPETILASSKMYKTGIEMQTAMVFDYHEAQSILYSGLNSKSKMEAEISGTKGAIFLDPQWHHAKGYTLEVDGEKTHFELPTTGKGYFYEINEVHQCLKQNKLESELWNHQNSKDLIGLLDTIRTKTNIKFPFEK